MKIAHRVCLLALLALALVCSPVSRAQQGSPPAGGAPAGGPPPGAPGPGRGPALPSAAEMKGKLAVQVFRNMQVLANLPADQILPSMGYIAAALNVRCDHCHVQGQFDSDEKHEKQAARAMMRMVASINGGTFNNQHAVTCYTCHRGSNTPVSTPTVSMTLAPLPPPQGGGRGPGGQGGPAGAPGGGAQGGGRGQAAETPPAPAGPPMPPVNDVLAKYIQALGGEAAIQKLTARSETGTVTGGNGQSTPIEEVRKAPDKATYTLHTQRGDNSQAYDGVNGWTANPNNGASDSEGDALVRMREWAEFVPASHLKDRYARLEVDGVESINGHDAYRVLAYREDVPDRFYFDKESGLLVGFFTRIESALGDLPQETRYDDYRAVGGVKIPFSVRVATIQGTQVYKWDKIDATASVDDSRFYKPNITPTPPPAGGPGRGGE
jgi:hypothetical protein